MSRGWVYNSGNWNAICDRCGQKLKATELRDEWTGLRVCSECWEPRHPQDFVRAKTDKISVPWSRPQTDVFIVLNYTQAVNDTALVTESVSTVADYYRYIGLDNYVVDQDLVNGSVVNLLTINSTSVDPALPTNEEEFTLTENVALAVGWGISVSDTATLSESISEVEGENPSDTATLSESIIAYTITNRLVNFHLINEVTLG